MSPVRKRRVSSTQGLAQDNDDEDDNTINEDDHNQRVFVSLPAASAPPAPAGTGSDDDDDDEDDSYSEIMSALVATVRGRAETERCNKRNSANLDQQHRRHRPGSPTVPPATGGGGTATNSGSTLDHKFNRLLTEVSGLRDQIGDRIETLNRRLSQTNRLFLAHQDSGHRSSKAGDLLLVGIPAQEGENLRECFVRIARRLGYAESAIPIVHIKRLTTEPPGVAEDQGNARSPSRGTGGEGPPASMYAARPKPTRYSHAVLDNLLRPTASCSGRACKPRSAAPAGPAAVQVQFVFRNARNEFYRRYLERGKAGTCLLLRELGYEGSGLVYVNENLTRCNLNLKAEAMRLKRDGKLKSVFTVNGQIYVKRTIDHRPELVTSSVDLLLLDGTKLNANKDCYPRVLEHIINTQSPQVLCRDYKEILGTLDVISTDPDESVRLYLACWLQKYCASWFNRDQDQQSIFSKAFLEKILQIIVRYLTDEPNVRAATFESLTYLIEKGYLDRDTTIKLNIVEELVSKPINEQFMDMCTNYIHLMVKIAPLVGSAKTQELLYTRFVKMCTCQINFVRKECATAFPVMCEVLGNEVFEKNLLPIFMKLCEDVIWTVRKACAEVMPFIALLCTLEKRRKVLVPIYKKFMFDTSLWVIKAALKNLGRFMATFAQLQILGLAYNQNLELSIVNAADEAFREVIVNTRQVTYSNQPEANVLLKNFGRYEKRFRDSILRHALLKLVKADEEPWKSRSEDCINVEAYLASVVFVEEHLVQRQSTGSTSDDGGGISKLADFYYVRHKSLSSSSSIASTSPTPSPLYRANQSYDEKNPLIRFMRYCSPLKNNFEHSLCNPSSSDGGDQGGGSDAFDNHGHWDSEDDNFASHHLPDLSLGVDNDGLCGAEDGEGGGTSGVIFDSDNPNHQAAAAANGAALDFIMESAEEDENVIDECFNSHQFWYISPGLALDLEFIDTDGDGSAGKDASNNNTHSSGGEDGDTEASSTATAAGSVVSGVVGTVAVLEDDTRNNNLTQGSRVIDSSGDGGATSAAMVVEDNENQNDSDSSYGSINNNESDNKLIYLYEDLLPQSQSSATGNIGQSSSSSSGAAGGVASPGGPNSSGSGGGGGASGAGGSSSSTVTPTMTTVERIRAAEQLKTMIRWENEEVEWNLLEDFLHMKNVNKELCLDCAYNFPAVVLTFGEKFWPILSRYFFDLCADVQDSVRRTMAASISKIAMIIGREQATRDLVPSYTEFLLDSDDIKFEVVRTLAEFLNMVDSCEHETLMNHLGMCLQPPLSMMNWRFRELAGQQIVKLARMHSKIRKENCLLYLVGLSLRLMLDKYDSVRKAGIDAFVECSHEFQKNDKVFEFFNKHFAFYSDWRRRQTYVIAAGKMLETKHVEVKIFRKHVFINVLKLASDAVPNVRIQVAKCLKEIIAPHPQFANDPEVEPMLQKLYQDKDCDVRGHVDGYQSMEQEMAAEAAAAAACSGAAGLYATSAAAAGGGSSSTGEHPSSSSSFCSEPVSSHLSYAEVTSGYLGSAMSSLNLDDPHIQLAGVMRILKHDDDRNEEQREQQQQQQQQQEQEVHLDTLRYEHDTDALINKSHGAEESKQQRELECEHDDDDECGEEAIEQPTSSMSTDDDAAYCSELESSAASTPVFSAARSIPLDDATSKHESARETEDNGNDSSNSGSTATAINSQVVPSAGSTEDFPELVVVNGESVDASPPTVAKKGVDGGPNTTSNTPKVRDNFFRRRSKGKK